MEFAADLWRLPPPFNMVVLLVLIPTTISFLGACVVELRKYADHRAAERFKMELIDNGLEPEEADRWMRVRVEPAESRRPDSVHTAEPDSASVFT